MTEMSNKKLVEIISTCVPLKTLTLISSEEHEWCTKELLSRLTNLEAKVKELESESAYMDDLTNAKIEAETKWAKALNQIADLTAILKALCRQWEIKP
jgi:hypothetical protein